MKRVVKKTIGNLVIAKDTGYIILNHVWAPVIREIREVLNNVTGEVTTYRTMGSTSEAYYVGVIEKMILVDASLGPVNVYLPYAKDVAREIVVKKIDTTGNEVRVTPKAGETIDGDPNFSIVIPWQNVYMVSDGSNWFMVF
jgi:hypothetical protein